MSRPRDEDPEEADRLAGAPHPRTTTRLRGQEAALAQVAAAASSGRLPHAWLIVGPLGVGKATLAWAIARALLTGTAEHLGNARVNPEDDIFRQTAALSHPGMLLVRRPWDEKTGRLKAEIPVDEIRSLRRFFQLSSSYGGGRVALIDAADELNTAAANALLKLLEEPPADGTLLLVSHRPARLLPTIRSRCRVLRCEPLGATDLAAALAATGAPLPADPAALADLSGGSVGRAVRLVASEGQSIYAEIVDLLLGVPRLDRARLVRLAERGTDRQHLEIVLDLALLCLERLARHAAAAPVRPASEREAALLGRLATMPAQAHLWAEVAGQIAPRASHARAVHLDPGQVILDTFLQIDAAAGRALLAA